jgi:hypothetical protein
MARIAMLTRASMVLVAVGITAVLVTPAAAVPARPGTPAGSVPPARASTPVGSITPGRASTPDLASTPVGHLATVRWVDPRTGRLVRSWTGPARLATPTRRTSDLPSAQPGTEMEPSIHRRHCTDPNQYWVVRNYPPLVCFANPGDIDVQIYLVYEVDSGDNTGWFRWLNEAGRELTTTIDSRWTSVMFTERVSVTHVHIN